MKVTIPLTIILLFLVPPLLGQINTERYRQDVDSLGFSGHIDFSATLSTGNTTYRNINIGGRLNYNWGTTYTFLVGDLHYIREKKIKIFDRSLVHCRHVSAIHRHLQLEMMTQYDFDKKRKLLSRQLLGSGLRWRILKKRTFKFRLGAAYLYEIEKYALPTTALHPAHTKAHRFSNYETFQLDLRKSLTALSITYFQPDINHWRDVKIISENALLIDIGKPTELAIKFNLRYDSQPPDGTKKLDTLLTFTIAFIF